MKKLFFFLLTTTFFLTASSQRLYFVYLQSEQEQPFFVRMDDKIHSSTAAGYLILSRLRDSTYNFGIGFLGNKWPEQRFSVTINRKDHGYLLKYFEGKGWGLFDLQTLSVQMAAVSNAGVSTVTTENKDVSKFTDILSKAADDPSLKEKTTPAKLEEKRNDIVVQPAIIKEEVKPPRVTKEEVKPLPVTKEDVKSPPETREEVKPILTDKPVVEEKKEESKPTEPEYKPSEITKNAENSTAGGIELTFIDKYADGDKDTIQILIPAKKPVLEAKKEEPKEERRFLEISADSSQVKQPVEKIPEPNAKAEQTVPANVKTKVKNNCPSTAVESDFFKLRKKMAAETNDYDMIDEARKVFKTKCFSVVQVKNLSALFLTDLGKYMFFDAFYTYVSDPENFTVLEAELKDQYYINRFRSMLRN